MSNGWAGGGADGLPIQSLTVFIIAPNRLLS